MKVCSKCGIEKDICEYRRDITKKDGHRPECKDCVKKFEREYRINNPEKNTQRVKDFYSKNPEKRLEYRKNYKPRKHQQRKERRKVDPLFVLSNNLRSRMYKFLITLNITKKNTTFEIVGCSPQELKEHLQKQFISGMSWENRTVWHIDHIVPLSSAKTEDELYKLCHYTNLQPLWVEENLKKSNKLLN